MKHTFFVIVALLFSCFAAKAQDSESTKHKKRHELSVSSNGINIHTIDSGANADSKTPKKDTRWSSTMSLDLGLNFMSDNTNYSDATVKNYLNVPANRQTAGLFNIRQSKSVYVNYYPLLESYRLLKTPGQKIYLTTGLGFQFYNFKYENSTTYTRNPSKVMEDTLKFSKNKLGIDYMNVPLMLTFKTRFARNSGHPKKDTWLVYGVGVTEGANIATWSKQISGERGKVKLHDHFSIADFNTCITGEIGIDGVIRLFGSYQVTSLYNSGTGLDQHPISLGIKISGI